MALNLEALKNMTPLEFNTSGITDPETTVTTLISNSNTVSEGYFGLSIMVLVFLALVYVTFRQDGDIRLDISRSILFSSGMTSIMGVVMLATPIISSFIHVMWFITIFIVMIVVVFNLKRKGL